MSEEDHDQVFVSNFSKIVAALFLILALCIAAAVVVDPGDLYESEVKEQRAAENLAPTAEVATTEVAPDAAAPVAEVVAVAEPTPVAAETAAAKTEGVNGEKVYQTACAGCHTAGVLGAPKPGDKAGWETRASAAGGLEGLTQSAIAGKAAMPPRGGNPALSDAEIHAAVEFMLK